MKQKEVLIVGTGLAGLAAALRLTAAGYSVTMVEKNNQPGGRLNLLEKDGFKFDLGPTFFSMSYEFDELVKSTGIEYPFDFIELDPLFTVNIDGNPKNYTIYKDIEKLENEDEKRILFLKYIRGLKWEKVCIESGYEWTWVHKLHGRALEHLEITKRILKIKNQKSE